MSSFGTGARFKGDKAAKKFEVRGKKNDGNPAIEKVSASTYNLRHPCSHAPVRIKRTKHTPSTSSSSQELLRETSISDYYCNLEASRSSLLKILRFWKF